MTDTTDRELLELAAKAAGLTYIKPAPEYNGSLGLEVGSDNPMRCRTWNPLTDDGDALQLAVKLRIEVEHNHQSDSSLWVGARIGGLPHHYAVEYFDAEDQRLKATRRAIVRAAAAARQC